MSSSLRPGALFMSATAAGTYYPDPKETDGTPPASSYLCTDAGGNSIFNPSGRDAILYDVSIVTVAASVLQIQLEDGTVVHEWDLPAGAVVDAGYGEDGVSIPGGFRVVCTGTLSFCISYGIDG